MLDLDNLLEEQETEKKEKTQITALQEISNDEETISEEDIKAEEERIAKLKEQLTTNIDEGFSDISNANLEQGKEVFAKWVKENESAFPSGKIKYSGQKEKIIVAKFTSISDEKMPVKLITSPLSKGFAGILKIKEGERYFDKINSFEGLTQIQFITENSIETIDCSHCHATGHEKCLTCQGTGQSDCKKCGGLGKVYKTLVRKETQDMGLCHVCGGSKQIPCQVCGGGGSIQGACLACNGVGNINGAPCQSCGGRGVVQTKCSHCNGRGSSQCNNCNHAGRVEQVIEVPYSVEEKCSYCSGIGKVICPDCLGDGHHDCHVCDGGRQLLRAGLVTLNINAKENKVYFTNINEDETREILTMFKGRVVDKDEFFPEELNNFSEEQKQKHDNEKTKQREEQAKIKMLKYEIFEFIKGSFEYEGVRREIYIFGNKLYVSSEPITKAGKAVYSIAKTTLFALDVGKELLSAFKKKK